MHMSTPSPSQSGLVAPVAGFPPPRCDDVYSIGILWFWHCRAGFLLFLFWTKFGWNGWDGYVGYVGWVSNGFWRSKMFLFSCCTRFVKTDVMTTCRWHRDICKLYVGYLLIVIISVERASKKNAQRSVLIQFEGFQSETKEAEWLVTRRLAEGSKEVCRRFKSSAMLFCMRSAGCHQLSPWGHDRSIPTYEQVLRLTPGVF